MFREIFLTSFALSSVLSEMIIFIAVTQDEFNSVLIPKLSKVLSPTKQLVEEYDLEAEETLARFQGMVRSISATSWSPSSPTQSLEKLFSRETSFPLLVQSIASFPYFSHRII
jgi:hypothetical protein